MLKMKILISAVLFTILSVSWSSCCHKPAEKAIKSDITQKSKEVLGISSWARWQERVPWDYSAASYNPQNSVIKELKKALTGGDYSFMLFGGSWCGDSEIHMPVIYKMFELAGYDIDKIKLIGLDRNKNEPTNIGKTHEVEKVPTLIVFKNDTEIGRIIENPDKNWEEDLLQIIK